MISSDARRLRLLTLNTHSLMESDYDRKLTAFADAAAELCPDVIALQEVNQRLAAPECPEARLPGYRPAAAATIVREDNHALRAVRLLAQRGADYHWTWLPVKCGYGRFEEGLALLSRSPILETDECLVSRSAESSNWKTRRLLGIRTQAAPDAWFYSVHYGWWNDAEEPFSGQWHRTQTHLADRGTVWLMGDFNCPASVRGEGYDLITRMGWHDGYRLAEARIGCNTASSEIDGWKGTAGDGGIRIDQLWCSRPVRVTGCEVVFDGVRWPMVSDHCGVLLDYERSCL